MGDFESRRSSTSCGFLMSNHYAARDALLKSKGFANYAAYLESQTWADIRIKVLNAANRRCCACKKWATQVHHEQYTEGNLFGADSLHLFAICAKHHEAIEFRNGAKIFDPQEVSRRLSALIRVKNTPPPQAAPIQKKTQRQKNADRRARKKEKAAVLAVRIRAKYAKGKTCSILLKRFKKYGGNVEDLRP